VDIALLLPPEQAKTKRMLAMSPLCSELGSLLGKAVDLVNLRVVSTVFQKEIIAADRRIHTGNAYAADEFEMLVLSFFQSSAKNGPRSWRKACAAVDSAPIILSRPGNSGCPRTARTASHCCSAPD